MSWARTFRACCDVVFVSADAAPFHSIDVCDARVHFDIDID
jgi:hypothetical protein